jgi:IS4 transposase
LVRKADRRRNANISDAILPRTMLELFDELAKTLDLDEETNVEGKLFL